jgi:hypothetical protein
MQLGTPHSAALAHVKGGMRRHQICNEKIIHKERAHVKLYLYGLPTSPVTVTEAPSWRMRALASRDSTIRFDSSKSSGSLYVNMSFVKERDLRAAKRMIESLDDSTNRAAKVFD